MNALLAIPGGAGPDVAALLAPLSAELPCGLPIRHDAVFTEIRLLREEDDPSLPMGQWERPLKRADWVRIEQLCSTVLATRAKDLQLAAWLAEAWTRQRGLAGLVDGLWLIDTLLRQYWPTLHPLVGDAGDSEARLAPLEWLNRSLSVCVRLHAVLFVLDGERTTPVTLALWERLALQEMAPADAGSGGAAPALSGAAPVTRADMHAASARLRPVLEQTAAAADACLERLRAIAAVLHVHLADEAPNLGQLTGTLEAVARMVSQIGPVGQERQGEAEQSARYGNVEPDACPMAQACASAPAAPLIAPAVAIPDGRWRNRREAYATLEALADYLGEVEPHSPTPFLIRRAANWGRMTLPEVIAEIIREEGDASRVFQVLGIRLDQGG